jgi:hypothetical protein
VAFAGSGIDSRRDTGVLDGDARALVVQSIATIHAAGGLASYNHPYGTTAGSVLPAATQDSTMAKVATSLLTNKAFGCDIIEVGYQLRSRIDLDHHVKL